EGSAREAGLRLPRPIRRRIERQVVAPRLGRVQRDRAVPRGFGRVAQAPRAVGGAGGECPAVFAARLRGARGVRGGVGADQGGGGARWEGAWAPPFFGRPSAGVGTADDASPSSSCETPRAWRLSMDGDLSARSCTLAATPRSL